MGPVGDTIEVFTEQEKQKLIAKGVPEQYIGKYKSVSTAVNLTGELLRKWGHNSLRWLTKLPALLMVVSSEKTTKGMWANIHDIIVLLVKCGILQ